MIISPGKSFLQVQMIQSSERGRQRIIWLSWLVNSMTNEIGKNFLHYGTTREIWVAAKEFYSSKKNTSEIFEIESKLHDLRQGDFSVNQYYGILTHYWQ